MTDRQNIDPPDPAAITSPAEVSAAGAAMNSLMGALRNYHLFPPDHPSTIEMLASVNKIILNFTGRFGDLCCEIGKGRLLYDEVVIHDGPASEENPAYILYRDGIRWLQIANGIDSRELQTFFRLFNDYRVMSDDSEDDLVSALWREELPHIIYMASDELWDDEPVLDFSLFETSGKQGGGLGSAPPAQADDGRQQGPWEAIRPGKNDDGYEDLSVACGAPRQEVWTLSGEEKKTLDREVRACAGQKSRQDIIGLMSVVLSREKDRHAYGAFVNYLKEEFRLGLLSRDFKAAAYLLDNIRKIAEGHKASRQWSGPLYDRFHDDIVKPEILSTLIPVWHELSALDPALVKDFTGVLRLLPARAAVTLAAMINRIASPNARSLMIEIIASFASRDQEVLAVLLLQPEEDLALRMMRVVNNLADQKVMVALLRKASAHPKGKVRTEAQRTLHKLRAF